MSVSSKVYPFQLVKIQPEERLATSSEADLALSLVTGYPKACSLAIPLSGRTMILCNMKWRKNSYSFGMTRRLEKTAKEEA